MSTSPGSRFRSAALSAPLAATLLARLAELDAIPAPRRERLDALADFLHSELAAGRPVRLLFLCTHNSRRSQMAQLWCAAVARGFGLDLRPYSAGTEATAFHPFAVAALEDAGFLVEPPSDGPNPVYRIRTHLADEGTTCFSKGLDDPSLPRHGFVAVPVCSDADAACPFVPGAMRRFALPFEDPRLADGTPQAAAAYTARSNDIARELAYVASRS